MTPQVKGWCPGALRPMESGDGLVVRVRAWGGRLTQNQARGLADLAARFGNGLIDLSARANLQLRGVRDHQAVLEGLTALGLVDGDAGAESRRNLLVTPFWQADDGTQALAEALTQALREDLPLPGKFGFALDSGPTPVLHEASADIRIERAPDGTLLLRPDGSTLGRPVTPGDAIPAAMDLSRWFLASGGAEQGRGRMKTHHAPLPEGFTHAAAAAQAAIPTPGATPLGHLAALAFGQMRAETLAALADLAPLRLTPWRMMLLEGHAGPAALPGVIATPDDPLLRVVACVGAPACPQALAPVRDLARQWAPFVPQGRLLHVSGCAKGCARPAHADITLVAGEEDFARAAAQPFDPAFLMTGPDAPLL
jgi:precorrin-3B synthase